MRCAHFLPFQGLFVTPKVATYFQVCIIVHDHCHLLRVMPVGMEEL